ncbi:DUF3078 domain-containing protein [uncultured Croceitalea sp.]|uniref:DUF3078 domain-containing protein n=1 Tax=uncultured Croceitalea sp. TaxID=1798908 RepID=UPI0033068C49
MLKNLNKTHYLAICAFIFTGLCFGQTDEQDDTADTIVIRWEQKKLKNILRGVRLQSPRVSFSGTKPLLEKPKKFLPLSFWDNENKFGLNVNEVAFVNWNAGGENSVSALANMLFSRKYKFRYINWDSELRLRYGINAQEGRKLRKTDDFIRLTSAFAFRRDTLSHWYYQVKMNFNTQFSNGFKYPNRENPISRFMAPGYLFLGAGTSYIPENKEFNLYISPFTQKATFVFDEDLSEQGSFGVEKGKNVFMELGFLVTNTWETEVAKNVKMNHRISMYTDYLRSFGNIDVDWELNFTLQVNKYLQANIGTHLIFDDDILFDEVVAEDGTVLDAGIPRIQFKQLLGIGLGYAF